MPDPTCPATLHHNTTAATRCQPDPPHPNPGCPALRTDGGWRGKSIAQTRRDAEQRHRDLGEAVHAAQQLLRFIQLSDMLVLGQLAELARLAVLLCVCQMEAPRKAGLYMVTGTVEDPNAPGREGIGSISLAGGGGARGGLGGWSRAPTFASVAMAAAGGTLRRRSMFGAGGMGGLGLPRPGSQGPGSTTGDGALSPRTARGGGADDDDDRSDAGSEVSGVPAPAPLFVFSPGSEELSAAVANLPREIVHVVMLSASALISYPEVGRGASEVGRGVGGGAWDALCVCVCVCARVRACVVYCVCSRSWRTEG